MKLQKNQRQKKSSKPEKGGKLASKEATGAQKEKNDHFNVLKQIKFHLEFLYSAKYLSIKKVNQ